MKGDRFLEIVSRQLARDHEDPAHRRGRARLGHLRDQPRGAPPLHREAVGGGGPEPRRSRTCSRSTDLRRELRLYHDRLGPPEPRAAAGCTRSARELACRREPRRVLGARGRGGAAGWRRRDWRRRLAGPDTGLPVWAGRRRRVARRPAPALEARLAEARARPPRSTRDLPERAGLARVAARARRALLRLASSCPTRPSPRPDTLDLLSILAGQAAATLHALALVARAAPAASGSPPSAA